MPRCVPLFLLLGAIGCDPATIVTTNVTLPTSPSPVVTTPVTTTNPTCPTCPTSPCVTATCSGSNPQVPNNRSPEILSFDADSRRVSKGAAAILRWEISDPSALVRIDPGIGSVGAVGFLLVFPTGTTTYTLTARNSVATVQRTLTISVFYPET
jgi:hypothetical protein